MSAWLSCHGAGAIKASDNSFVITANSAGALIRPTNANELKGTILFPLPSLPQNVSHLVKVAIDFSSQTAEVDAVTIMSGGDQVFQKNNLEKTQEFTVNCGTSVAADQRGKGLVLAVALEFETISGRLKFRSVELEVAGASPSPVESIKFDTGYWNITDIRRWDQPREKNEGPIVFSKVFSSPPTVVVSMAGASVDKNNNFRVKVYATNVNSKGFVVHADAWGGTTLYSCGVSWIAIGC
ncbi:hypothetical protein DL767_001519 [Monosporascus sp. MG133]|nr:hypothetical protein DL767_001519 [Monosporascus sp. MG133]